MKGDMEDTQDRTATSECLIGEAAPPALHVMSFNVRVGSDGLPDPWPDRRAAAATVINDERPTVIGTQEGLYPQLRDLASDIPSSYDWIGIGREGGSRGEIAAIFYDTRRLEPREFDHFWLSDTPSVVGSATWGNQVVRMATWVRFHDRRTDREFLVLNTHLDHAVEGARRKGAQLISRRLAATSDIPIIVTGDFNTPAEASESYRTLTTDTGLCDTWLAAEKRLTPAYATFHGYQSPTVDGDRIDWILVSPHVRVTAAAINTRTLDGRWASDHWPVQALIEL